MASYRPVVPIYPSQTNTSRGPYPALATTSPVPLRRPFRHRRKDPSCDACRERKVKCDASGSNSCTECRTRNIKCQFTREHMRRLTSMKQVTDLERKLRHAKLEVSNLQSQMQRQRLFALEDSEWAETTWRRNSNESDVTDSSPTHDFRRVREEIIQRSPGLFNVPPAWRDSVTDPVGDTIAVSPQALPRPTLPPLKFAEHLLHLFETEVFAISPYHDLHTFINQTKELYNNGGGADIPPNTSRSWLVLFFATLALTCHCIQDETIAQHYTTEGKSATPIGRDLADSAAYFFGPITKINTLDDVRGALTLSIYFKHINELSASNIWLGLSCKIAQYLGCHRYSPGMSREEEEIRANAWWDIYLFDRLMVNQHGCEMTILDNDCDLPPPDLSAPSLPITEAQGRVASQSKLYSFLMVHGKVVRLLRDSPYLTQDEIDKLADRIRDQYDRMPTIIPTNKDPTLNPPWYLDSHIFIHITKFRVYRHNLTPNAPPEARLRALRSLIELAIEASAQAAQIFKDTEDPQTSPDDAHENNRRVIRIVYPEHCQYMYSCAMYLIIAKLWEFVLPLVIGLQAVGNKLPINKCCCRYLWGVIIFTEGRNAIPGTARTEGELDGFWRDKDEEIVALVAAEMHQEPRAWEAVWSKNEGRTDRTFDILSTDEDVEMENTDDVSMSGESASDMRSGPSLKESRSAMTSLESEGSPPEYGRSRPVLTHRWSGEDETWNAMVMYVRNKCGEQKQKHNMEDEMAATRAESGDNRDTIQRRMSISNLL